MSFKNDLPEWNAPGVEPPKSLREIGWQPGNKPASDYFNWFFNKTYQSLLDVMENAQHKSEKGQANGYAGLDANGKVPSSQLALTKNQVGLGSVDNVKQASKTEFDEHKNDESHLKNGEREKWNKAPSKEEMTTELNKKVDKVTGKGLSSNDYTSEEKTKLAGVEPNANKYTHPATHPASMITESQTKQFSSHAEKESWNSKYVKPLEGIPKIDLESGVQSALEKAESAVQDVSDLATKQELQDHEDKTNNPHAVTKVQVGLENVDNVKQASKAEHDALINSFTTHSADYTQQLGTATLQTTDKTLKGAINEVFQTGNNVKSDMVDALLSVDDSLPIDYESSWTEIESVARGFRLGVQIATGSVLSSTERWGSVSPFGGGTIQNCFVVNIVGLSFSPSLIVGNTESGAARPIQADFSNVISYEGNPVYRIGTTTAYEDLQNTFGITEEDDGTFTVLLPVNYPGTGTSFIALEGEG